MIQNNKLFFFVLCQFLFGVCSQAEDKKVVFVAGPKSHGFFAHEHAAGCKLLAEHLEAANLGIKTVVVTGGFPQDQSVFNDADAVVVACDGGVRHLLNKNLKEFDEVMKRGVGLACIHYGVETTKGPAGDHFLKWIGGYFEPYWSVNPVWNAAFKLLPSHPITQGVMPFTMQDEWYYHMRFREATSAIGSIVPILSAHPPENTMKRLKPGVDKHPHHGNPDVADAVLKRKEAQHVAWAYQRGEDYNYGRGFGFTGAHFHENWASLDARRLVLNAIAWIAKVDVPKTGVPSKEVTLKDLLRNQDFPKPENWKNQKNVEQKMASFRLN
ncbi:ThuA domain-containing protein [Candidatus Chordibacter forsetii]|uniref:ThuA domain-containing protein n=1 Tax=Candidatus Chordibacter forsetii TaxID=3381758 RepID=UPI003899BD38